MITYVATYNIDIKYSLNATFDILSTRYIKYKFCESSIDKNKTICYLTIIANNRLHLRKLKTEGLHTLKKLGKVELVVGVGW